ncbi:MAG: redoxin domain-containing protein, partial [Spirulinaceae cyanobacterium RM2_2_10]|nr:redoxin domain-containing protein [Spirulinaceae cyanobacterium RM2_2_10]
ESMKHFAADTLLNFPYLRDPSQDVARGFGAQYTPEVFLLNQAGIICYQGAIDDNPRNPAAVKRHHLREAIAALLAGQAIAPSVTPTTGSALRWRR